MGVQSPSTDATDVYVYGYNGTPCAEIHHYHMYYSKGFLFRNLNLVP